jgi:hypothetical protein
MSSVDLYKKDGENLVITVPLKTKRQNLYDDDYNEEMDNIIGLFEGSHYNGLCYRIDMDYKSKPDQWSDYFFKLNGTLEEFVTMCDGLGVEYVIHTKESLPI